MKPVTEAKEVVSVKAAAVPPQRAEVRRGLSFKEKQEFESIEKEMPLLRAEKAALEEKMNSGSIGFEELQRAAARIGEITTLLDEKEMRWLELSERI
jgi:ATP-binding cassette subfamily F protein uup